MSPVCPQVAQNEDVTTSKAIVRSNICSLIKEKLACIFKAVLAFLRLIFCFKRVKARNSPKNNLKVQIDTSKQNKVSISKGVPGIRAEERSPAGCVVKSKDSDKSVKAIQRAFRSYISKNAHDASKSVNERIKVAEAIKDSAKGASAKTPFSQPLILKTEVSRKEVGNQPLVSPDPFNYRGQMIPGPIVDSIPESDNVSQFGEYLVSQDMGTKLSSIFDKKEQYPPVIHFIWCGSEVPSYYLKNIVDAKKLFYDHEVIIWTDQKKAQETGENIRWINIFDSLSNDFWMGLKDPFILQFMKIVPNYGEASDILRFLLLYHFGGMYFDTDSVFCDLTTEAKKVLEELKYGFAMSSVGIDFFITKAKHEVFKKMIESIKGNYTKKLYELYGKEKVDIDDETEVDVIVETELRTGDFLRVLNDHLKSYQPDFLQISSGIDGFVYSGTDKSWVRAIKPFEGAVSDKVKQRVITEILWDLKSQPDFIILYKYEYWLRKDHKDVIKYAVDYIKKHYPDKIEAIKCVITDNLAYDGVNKLFGENVFRRGTWEYKVKPFINYEKKLEQVRRSRLSKYNVRNASI